MKLLTTLALVAFIASPAIAATKTKKHITVKTTTNTPAVDHTEHGEAITTTASATYPTHGTTQNGPELAVDLGLGTAVQKFHVGVGFKAQWPMHMDGNEFKFGVQTGFYIGPSSPTTWVLPILATAEYDFYTSSNMKPYFGLGIGLSIYHVSLSSFGINASGSSTDFAFLAIPGMNFTDSIYFVEFPIGTLNNNFAFLPTIGMHF